MHNKTIFYFLISSDFHYLRWMMCIAHSSHEVRVCHKPMQDPDLSVLSHIKLYLPRLPALLSHKAT
jgi:hypothetical protein